MVVLLALISIDAANRVTMVIAKGRATYHRRDGRRRPWPPLGQAPEGRIRLSSLPHPGSWRAAVVFLQSGRNGWAALILTVGSVVMAAILVFFTWLAIQDR